MQQKLKYTIISLLIILLFFISNCKNKTKINLDKDIPYNLLFITIDTLRADHLGCYGYDKAQTPNIDRLANNGIKFENCYASVPLTLPSHSTIFTGKEPFEHQIRSNINYFLNEEETTLAELMKAEGFLTYAIISSFVLHSKFGLNQGFDIYDDSLDIGKIAGIRDVQITADKVYNKFSKWFEVNYNKKFFSWLHFYDPHANYNPPEKYLQKFKANPYDGEISYVDFYIGKIVEDLKKKNILKNTIIIITSDHGESLGEHNELTHGVFCYNSTLKVPLIFYNPSAFKKDRVVSNRVKLKDIMPTMIELFDLETSVKNSGSSFAEQLFSNISRKSRKTYFESVYAQEEMNWAPLTGIIDGDYKYISLPKPELYNLKKDPNELVNLYNKERKKAKQLDKKLKHYMLSNSSEGQSARKKLSENDLKKLESLGYISSNSQKSKKKIDPKTGIILLNKIYAAQTATAQNNLAESKILLDELSIDENALHSTLYYEALIKYQRKKKDIKSIENTLIEAIKIFPKIQRFRKNLALIYFQTGELEKSIKICKNIIKENPKFSSALILLSNNYKKKGDIDKAVTYLEKARKIEPTNLLLQTDYSFLLLQNKKYDQVITECLDNLSKGNKTADIYNHLGMAYFKKKNIPDAQDAYLKALSLKEKNPLTLSNLGTLNLMVFRLKKDKEFLSKAVGFYSKAIDINPELITALNGLAVSFSYSGNQKKAILYWEKSLKINPAFTNLYFNLGITYLKIGENKKALKHLMNCKENYSSKLSQGELKQLDNLINEAKN